MDVKRLASSESNVWKYVFEFNDKGVKPAVAEAVLYKYESFYERTVLCVSVQSGCAVGCTFCGTGKKFIRDLTPDEIVGQVQYALKDMDIEDVNSRSKRFQIMFMSMGEPTLNIDNVCAAITELNNLYPNAVLLLSTVGTKTPDAFQKIFDISKRIDKVGLQFSIHEAFEDKRDELIPFKNKLTLREIRDTGTKWNQITGRPVYLNYCIGEHNQSKKEMDRLKNLFSPATFNLTFSVICSADETMKDAGYRELDKIHKVTEGFIEDGYDVRVFDPAGQDDIGGGCGQLWFVQDWMQKNGK